MDDWGSSLCYILDISVADSNLTGFESFLKLSLKFFVGNVE